MTHRLGIDLGGTSAKIALVDSRQKIIRECSVPTAGFPNPEKLSIGLAGAIRGLIKGEKIRRIGVGVAGDIDSHKGIVRVSPNLGWNRVPLGKLIAKYTKCDVVVDNDANAAAWGIYKTQAPKNATNVIVMTLGTGVGGGIIINGELLRGTTGSAGEVGHMNIEENGPLCNCGNRGCLETYVGGPHLVRRVCVDLQKGKTSSLQTIFKKNPEDITPYKISVAAEGGDSYALSIWEGVGRALGIAIGDLVYILNPQMIFFTGGIAQADQLILKPLWATLNKRSFKTPVQAVRIKVAKGASQVGVIGASLL